MWFTVFGHFADGTAGVLGHLHQILAGLQQLLGKRAREHRIRVVVAVRQPIERGLAGAGREHRKHALRQLRHRREPAAAGERTGAGTLERIVAAGVEHQDRGAHILVLQPLDDAIGEHRGVADQLFLAFAGGGHVGGQQEILAGDLKAVACIEEERGIAGPDRLVERQQALAEGLPGLVFGHHHREAELFQGIAHGAGVVDGLLQLWDVLVIVVADHQRDALFGLRGRCRHQQRSREAEGDCSAKRQPVHVSFPALSRSSRPVKDTRNPSCRSRQTVSNGSIRDGGALGPSADNRRDQVQRQRPKRFPWISETQYDRQRRGRDQEQR